MPDEKKTMPDEEFKEALGSGSPVGGSPNKPEETPAKEGKKSATSEIRCWKCGKKFSSAQELYIHKKSGECEYFQKTPEGRKWLQEQKLKEKPSGGEQLKSYFADKGITGKTFSKEGMKNALTSAGAGTLIKGLDKYGGSAVSQVKNNLKFAIYFPLALLSVFNLAVPTIEGYMGTTIVPSSVSSLMWKSWPIILAGLFGVALPPSVILGKSGVSFDILNKVCLFSIAGSAAIWGGNTFLLPAVKTFMPEEFAMLMCLMKYRGNMQVCIAPNQTVTYDKTGTYETLKVEMGAVTPSQTIPPPNPVPDTWSSQYPYELPLTLSNKNTVGSEYDISVDKIDALASPYESGIDFVKASEILNSPYYPIKPGGTAIITARFNKAFYSLPINCKQYTYFKINVTTEQIGGGSAKFGLIESDQGMDNQNFMYFFNPDVKTEPGPLDIYTYTLPFVIPVNSPITGYQPNFGVYIKIKNKVDGIAFIENLTLIQIRDTTTPQQPIEISSTECLLSGGLSTYTVNPTTSCPPGKTGNCLLITIDKPIKKDEEITFRCNGRIKSTEFYGKTTDFISVNAYYTYVQTLNEQIACVKAGDMLNTFCLAHSSMETCQETSICQWCDRCFFNRTSAYPNDVCIPSDVDCGYHCVKDQCGATYPENCDSTHPCEYPKICGYDCTCTYSVAETERGTRF
jgi:hypothetical protein